MDSDILVDTSVLIDLFRKRKTRETTLFLELDLSGQAYSIPVICAQEVLQGARTKRDWQMLEKFFLSADLVVPRDPVLFHFEAAEIFYDCRRKGITLRSSIDCMIAQLAIENDVSLLHADSDYDKISRVRKLKQL